MMFSHIALHLKQSSITLQFFNRQLCVIKVLRQFVQQSTAMSTKTLHANLWDSDPELFDLIKKEKKRQQKSLEMIASENFTSLPVLQSLSSCLHNKYSEGLPGQR